MHKLLEKVEKELDNIAEKGITNSNLDTTYKLIDIYKDIKESKYYETNSGGNEYDARMRDSRGRYMENEYGRYYEPMNDGYDRRTYSPRRMYKDISVSDRYENYPMLDEKTERYMNRMREGMENYQIGKERYRNGDNQERMIDGIEMVMSSVCMFVESLFDFAESPTEKEIIRKHLDKMKKM